MKRAATFVVLVVLAATVSAAAAGFISKAQAEQDALKAVNDGSVIQAVLDTQGRIRIWSVDIAQPTHEYESPSTPVPARSSRSSCSLRP